METFNELAEKWPSAWVTRSQLWKFSGGLIHPHTMRNLDSQGLGIKNRVKIGRKVAYPVKSVVEWLDRRVDYEFEK